MKEHPILFSTQMVQALLDRRKTQTRRIIKPQPTPEMTEGFCGLDGIWRFSKPTALHPVSHSADDRKCPYGKPGDLLWVREAFAHMDRPDCPAYKCCPDGSDGWDKIRHEIKRWNSPILMPKDIARIWLQVEDVKAERLHDISEEDAKAEGVELNPDGSWRDYISPERLWQDDAIASFASLWQSINGRESWEANPWLFAVTFRVLSTTGRPAIAEQAL